MKGQDWPVGNKEIPPFNPDIYPNPCQGVLSIKNLDISDYAMEIFNTMGQPFPFTIKKDQIDISPFPSGVYILKLTNKAIRYSIKIYKL